MYTEAHRPMPIAQVARELWSPFTTVILAAGIALAGVSSIAYIGEGGSVKVIGAAVAGTVGLIAAFCSGNPRLFCIWGLMFLIPFDLSKRFGHVFLKMGGENSFRAEVSDVFLAALAAYIVWDLWSGRLPGLRVPKVTYVWIAIMLLGTAWALFGTWRLTAAHEVFRMAKVMVLFLVVCNELQTPKRVLHACAGLTFGVIVQSIVGLIQYGTRSHLGLEILGETGTMAIRMLESSSVEGANVFRVGAFLSHPNVFGIFLACLLPIAVGCFLLRVGKGYKLFFLATSVLGMAALIATLSRSGWVSFAAAFSLLMILMILHRGLRRRSLLAAALASLALITVTAIFIEPIMARIFSSREAAMLGRAEYIHDAWGMIKARPLLGWGLNSYVFAVPPFTKYGGTIGAREHYRDWIPPVHNIYYLWWSETGLVGLAMHLVWIGFIVRVGIGNLRVKNEVLFTANAACLAGILAFLVDGFFSFSLRFNSILRVFWVLAAIIMAVHYWRLRDSSKTLGIDVGHSPVNL
jgi:hypothetical protein